MNDHHTKVRDALMCLLTETVTDGKHKEILRRVLGPDVAFDTLVLSFDNPNMARLVKYGVKECCVGDRCMQTLSGALCLEAHQLSRSRTTS